MKPDTKRRMLATQRRFMHRRILEWVIDRQQTNFTFRLNNSKHWAGFVYTKPFRGWYCYGACWCAICEKPRDLRILRGWHVGESASMDRCPD